METLDRNLDILLRQFRKKGPALRGYRKLSQLLKNQKSKDLSRILRDHRDDGIYNDEEVISRDEIDYLIEFYSLLFVGMVCDYIPQKLPQELEKEILGILENDEVNQYFTKRYPLVLPGMLIRNIKYKEYAIPKDFRVSKIDARIFEKFILLNDEIRSDEDVDTFLWFLDDGTTENFDIYDIIGLLKNRKELTIILRQNEDGEVVESVLTGYLKFLNFVTAYHKMLQRTESSPYLTFSLYHYQSYWFRKLKGKLGDSMSNGLTNIQKAAESILEEEITRGLWVESAFKVRAEGIKSLVQESKRSLEYLLKLDPVWPG